MSPDSVASDGAVEDRGESFQTSIIVCAVVTWTIAAAFVGMRFYTRRCLIRVLGAEDWVILASLVFSAINSAGFIEQALYGLGTHRDTVSTDILHKLGRAAWLTTVWYALTLALTKISILLLYIRILTYPWVRKATWAMLAVVVVTSLWAFAVLMTACIPLQAFWDGSLREDGAYCHPMSFYWAATGLHMGSDFLIFLLPLPVICSLRVRWRQKALLYFIFAFGFFVCAVSTVRLLQLISQTGHSQDFTFDVIGVSVWTLIEVNTAIVCACIMTLKPLIAKVFPNLLDPRGMSVDTPPGAVVSQGGRPLTIGSKPFRVIRESWLLVHDHRVDSDAPILRELRDEEANKNGRVSLQALEAPHQDDLRDVDLPAALPAARIPGSDAFDSSSTEQLTLPEARQAYRVG